MKRLLLIVVVLSGLTAMAASGALGWLLLTESGLRWSVKQVRNVVPGELRVTGLAGRLAGPVTLEALRYELAGTVVEVDRLALDWRVRALLGATVQVEHARADAVRVVLPPGQDEAEPIVGLPTIRLPWRTVVDQLTVASVTVVPVAGEPVLLNDIGLRAQLWLSRLEIAELSLSHDLVRADAAGMLHLTGTYDHDLRLRWRGTPPGWPALTGEGRLRGDVEHARLSQSVTGPFEFKLDGQLHDLLTLPRWRASVELIDFDSARLNAGWRVLRGGLVAQGEGDLQTFTVSGEVVGRQQDVGPFEARFELARQPDNRFAVERLALRSTAGDSHMVVRGEWQPGPEGGHVELALHWQALRWPMLETARFDSEIGSAWLSGGLADYRFGFASAQPWSEVPSSTWFATARGGPAGLDGVRLRIEGLDGELQGDGRVLWSPHLQWQMNLHGVDINPAAQWSDWPGQLAFELKGRGGEATAEFELVRLAGQLRGYPLTADGRVRWVGQEFEIETLAFAVADARLNAAGRVGERMDVQWRLTARDLAALYPGARGALWLQGNLLGPRQSPNFAMTFEGEDVALEAYRAGRLQGALAADLLTWRQLALNVELSGGWLGDYPVQRLSLDASGQEGRHTLALNVDARDGALTLKLSGVLDGQQWRGQLDRADVESRDFGTWRLRGANELGAVPGALSIGPLCWARDDAGICLQGGGWDRSWRGLMTAEGVELAWLAPWLPQGLALEGAAGLKAEAHLQPGSAPMADAVLSLTPGVVSYPLLEGERDRWAYAGGQLTAALTSRGINAAVGLALANGDRLDGEVALPNMKVFAPDLSAQPLEARMALAIKDLGLVEALVADVQDVQGEVLVELNAAGTLGRPRLTGQARLVDGALRIPRLGLKVDRIAFEGHSEDMEHLVFSLDARSGGGRLAARGRSRLDPGLGWPTELTLTGEDFEVSRMPEARVDVSPDLAVELQGRTVHVVGDLHIPYAKLQPKDLTTAVTASDDVVVLGGDGPGVEKWAIHSRVRLTLGERVTFYGFGFEGAFGGNVVLEDSPGQLTRAVGELTIPQGRYRAYGQRLEVEHGRLLFSGGPLTNPGLDIRAVRQVDDVTAGLKLGGTLRNPSAELFAIPAMGQTEALSYLVLGRPLAQTSSGEEGQAMARAALALGLVGGDRLARSLGDRFGLDEMRIETAEGGDQASLMMGRYLSPRLYVGYGIGLIENINVFKVRYRLSRQWQLEGESGEHHGADLLYSIETGKP